MSKELEQLKIMVAELGISEESDDLEAGPCASCCIQGGSGTNGVAQSPF